MRNESKISPKSVGWAQADIVVALRAVPAGEGLPLFRVLGVANGFKTALDRNGNMTEGLTGQFRAIPFNNPNDVVESGVLYLPSGLHYQIAGALKTAMASDPHAQGRFSLDVYARASSNQVGYEYYGQSKVEAERADVFNDLMEQSGELPKLPTPEAIKAAEAKADESGATKTK